MNESKYWEVLWLKLYYILYLKKEWYEESFSNFYGDIFTFPSFSNRYKSNVVLWFNKIDIYIPFKGKFLKVFPFQKLNTEGDTYEI